MRKKAFKFQLSLFVNHFHSRILQSVFVSDSRPLLFTWWSLCYLKPFQMSFELASFLQYSGTIKIEHIKSTDTSLLNSIVSCKDFSQLPDFSLFTQILHFLISKFNNIWNLTVFVSILYRADMTVFNNRSW